MCHISLDFGGKKLHNFELVSFSYTIIPYIYLFIYFMWKFTTSEYWACIYYHTSINGLCFIVILEKFRFQVVCFASVITYYFMPLERQLVWTIHGIFSERFTVPSNSNLAVRYQFNMLTR